MGIATENFWLQLRPVLARLADRVLASNASFPYALGQSSNESFLLRAYLSFAANGDGDEIAVTVDVRSDHGLLTVVSDLCAENGLIMENGPSASIESWDGQSVLPTELDVWLEKFEEFLCKVEPKILAAIRD